ncbi:cytosolic protein [Peribacillus cavernae]|uniref:Cytosolic protein n=1 Tax=Peribacillus cavernae TaxID=1674310 RepID=A0A3S0VLJ1_9BACI|nr:YlbD family protein [Peribacillus cavernae]MDQ0217201.1 hypothetical protein [Peribacillus cavernae]RUQ30328.1 cytosolic protein [Peribacillus cavernae]
MAQKKARPSVEKFKEFVKKHPKLRQEVKNGNHTWQDLFEEWYMFGGDHEQWEAYRGETAEEASGNEKEKSDQSSKSELMTLLLHSVKNMDINQIQQYIANANQALGAIQGVISSFQGEQPKVEEQVVQEQQQRPNPFVFRKD